MKIKLSFEKVGVLLGAWVVLLSAAAALWFVQHRTVIIPYNLAGQRIRLEVTQTSKDRARGLGGRDAIGKADGMLFIFPQADTHAVWMKDMRFPLDIIWLRDGAVVDMAHNVPPPDLSVQDADIPRYYPRTAADAVVELPSGWIERWGVTVGNVLYSTDGS